MIQICISQALILFHKKEKQTSTAVVCQSTIYIHKSLACDLHNDLCVSDKDKEILATEISKEIDKNILLSCCCRPPNGDCDNLITVLQKNHKKSVSEKKISYIVRDFNKNCLKYHKTLKQNTFTIKSTIPIINCPARIQGHSASLIDNILMTGIFNNSLKKGIIKSDVCDNFPIFFLIQLTRKKLRQGVTKNEKKKFLTSVK